MNSTACLVVAHLCCQYCTVSVSVRLCLCLFRVWFVAASVLRSNSRFHHARHRQLWTGSVTDTPKTWSVSVCLSVCLVCESVCAVIVILYLSVCAVCESVCCHCHSLSVCLCLSICLSVCFSACLVCELVCCHCHSLSVCLSVRVGISCHCHSLSVCTSVCLCLSICLSVGGNSCDSWLQVLFCLSVCLCLSVCRR